MKLAELSHCITWLLGELCRNFRKSLFFESDLESANVSFTKQKGVFCPRFNLISKYGALRLPNLIGRVLSCPSDLPKPRSDYLSQSAYKTCEVLKSV